MIQKTKAFIIHLPKQKHSVEHANKMLETLKQERYIEPFLFDGVDGKSAERQARASKRKPYPWSIKKEKVVESELRDYIHEDLWEEFSNKYNWQKLTSKKPWGEHWPLDKITRPGVIGCFYSHYTLWKHCIDLNEPIIILEDDVKLFRSYQPVDWDDILILSLGKFAFKEEPYKTYLESPTGAPQARPWRNFSMPGTSGYAIKPHIASRLVRFYRKWYCPSDNAINENLANIEIHNHLIGRTTVDDEGNVSMTKKDQT